MSENPLIGKIEFGPKPDKVTAFTDAAGAQMNPNRLTIAVEADSRLREQIAQLQARVAELTALLREAKLELICHDQSDDALLTKIIEALK